MRVLLDPWLRRPDLDDPRGSRRQPAPGASTGLGQGPRSKPGLEVWGLECPLSDKIRFFFSFKKTISETRAEKQNSF